MNDYVIKIGSGLGTPAAYVSMTGDDFHATHTCSVTEDRDAAASFRFKHEADEAMWLLPDIICCQARVVRRVVRLVPKARL